MRLELTPPESDDAIDITPMIDCIFLLVLFFMVTSTFIDEPDQESTAYSIVIPATELSQNENEQVTIRVNGSYQIRDAETEQEIADVETLLQMLRENSDSSGHPLRFRCDALIESAKPSEHKDLEGFEVQLPTADKATTIPQGGVDIVSVSKDGTFRFQDEQGERDVEDLSQLLKILLRRDMDKKKPIVLRCDRRCTVQQFMQVKNVLKQAKVETIFEEVEVRHGK